MKLSIFIGMLSFFFFPVHAEAQTAKPMSAVLLSSVTGVGTLEKIEAALKGTLEKDWYTYWRSPGDSGLPPKMDWAKSKNVKEVRLEWPAPKRFEAFGLYSYGYEGEVLFPLIITPERIGEAINLLLEIEIVACNKICIPQSLSLSLDIPEGRSIQSKNAKIIKAAFKSLPSKENSKDIRLDTAVLGKDSIVLTAFAREGFEEADIMIEAPDISLSVPAEIIQDESDPQRALFKVKAPKGIENLTEKLFGKKITVTLVNRGKSVEREFSF